MSAPKRGAYIGDLPQAAAVTDAAAATATAPAAISGGDAPTEAEFLALRTTVVALIADNAALRTTLNTTLDALRDANLMASA
jgi:hypothetical protein